ncbi:MAG TPA: peptidoglycan editing factor PgeF [Bryobacteraceae bacterium]|jgi:hypothetical protein|nr:peptidoglycan editing factor PgeF [Bryobacteraceae bacterium]
MIQAPNLLALDWLEHGFGLRDSILPAGIRTVKQIHSNVVREAANAGPACEADALVSSQPGVLVGVKTADCVPVLLADPVTHTVAAIHAGWRGSAANIAAESLREMSARRETRPHDVYAAIGPSIGVCCYEVGPEVARHFGAWIPEMRNASGPVHLDLLAVNEKQLRDMGVVNIWRSGACTFCRAERFFSFRREGQRAGRLISFIGVR